MKQKNDAPKTGASGVFIPVNDAAAAFEKAAAAMMSEVTEMQDFPSLCRTDDFFASIEWDATKPAPAPKHLLTIDKVPVIPTGGITMITGAEKSGKSHFLAGILSVLISGKPFGSIECLERPKSIVWIDTEQSAYNVDALMRRVYNQADVYAGTPAADLGLHVLKLRPYDEAQRREIVAAAVERYAPDVLIIDGVRDLIKNFNDEAESFALTNWILQALDARPTMRILAVLHTNPNGDKMRGHLGTELANKYNDIFICRKEQGQFKVKHGSRGREVHKEFEFRIDENGLLQSDAPVIEDFVMHDEDAALQQAFPKRGTDFATATEIYAAYMDLSIQRARQTLSKLKAGEQPRIKKRGKLWFLCEDKMPVLDFDEDATDKPKNVEQ